MAYFSQHDLRLLTEVTSRLMHTGAGPLLGDARLADLLLVLFKADFIGTTRWNPRQRCYEEPLCWGRDNEMSVNYRKYFQFVDPISPKLRRRRTPSSIYEAISLETLRKSEYYADFLLPNKLSEGMDTYLYDGARVLGDLRVWRRPGAPQLGEREAVLLGALQPHLIAYFRRSEAIDRASDAQAVISLGGSCGKVHASAQAETMIRDASDEKWTNVLSHIRGASKRLAAVDSTGGMRLAVASDSTCNEQVTAHLLQATGNTFSERERDVLRLVIKGLSDKEIARILHISYWTVRTHVGNAMRKVNASTRGELGFVAQRLGLTAAVLAI